MAGLYAKIRFSVQCFFALSFALLLSGCIEGGGFGTPFSRGNSGVVTTDQNAMPNIAWQTNGDRRSLITENKDFARQAAGGQPAQKVRVALLVPLSGKGADVGQSMLKAAQMALFDVGSANFELIPRDTRSTSEGAAAAAQQAAANHDDLILGPVFADDVKAVKPVASSAGIPVISFTTDWTAAGGNTYVMGFMPFTQVQRVAQYAQEKGFGRVAVIAPTTPYCDMVIEALGHTSVSNVKTQRYSPQQSDLTDILKDFADTTGVTSGQQQFNALMLPVGGEGLQSLMSMLDADGVDTGKTKLLGTGLWDDGSVTRNPALFGGWFAAPDPNLRRDFERRYQESYGQAPIRLASLAYDATALAAVLSRMGGGEPFSRSNLTNPRGFAGIDGVFRFRSDGIAEHGLAVLEIQSGRTVVVDPAPTAFISGT